MKKFYALLLLLFVMVLPLMGSSITRTLTFNANDLIFSKTDGYDVVELKGYPSLVKPGLPRVPRIVESILIPAGMKPTNVKIISQNITNIPGTYKLIPAQKNIPLPMPGKTSFPEKVQANTDVYSSSRLFPEYEIRVVGYGTKAGYRIAQVEILPLRYIPRKGILQFANRITYRIEISEGNGPTTIPTARQRDIFADEIRKIVVNPEDITSFAPYVSKDGSPSLVPPGNYEYVIITESPMDAEFQNLADWKTKKGVPATVVTVSWINSNYSGYDLQEKIRNFIIDAYNNWGTVYILLGGSGDQKTSGQNIVPARRVCYTTSGVGYYSDEDTIPSDLYYSDLNGNWDANGNHVWGEISDNVDMYADVYVGRASVYNSSMAQNFVNKVLTYEKTPPTTYLKKMLLPTGILWNSYEERPMQNAIANMTPAGWFNAKLYERDNNLSRTAMIDSMNKGYGMGHWVGHGNEVGIYYNGGSTAFLTSSDADGLTNGDKEGIAISIACFCGAWDEVPGGDCFSEHLVNRVGGGLIADMFNSRYGWGAYVGGYVPGPSERLDTTFYANIFENNVYHIGNAHGLAKDTWVPYADQGNEYEYTRWCLYENNLLGDPELPLWTNAPQVMSVTHNSTIPIGTNSFTVTVKESDNITPIPGALVCLMGKTDTGLYGTGITNSSGVANITVTASVPNDIMWVTVTAENHYPYEGYATVEAGCPSQPVLHNLFDFARDYTQTPKLTFASTDNEGNQIRYMVYWDIDPNFSAPDSDSTVTLYASGATVSYTFATSLTNGQTYYWKIKARDPLGSGYWGPFSEVRSFTIGTSLPALTCSWYQTTGDQFNDDNLIDVAVQGDSVILPSAGATVTDTLLQEQFESGLPPGWTVIDGNGDNHKWTVGTTGDIDSYTPPGYGTQYAYYSDDDAGNGVINYNEELISPAIYIQSNTQTLNIQYGYGFRVYQNGETYEVKAKFFKGGWGSWNTIATYTSSTSATAAIDLSSYLPADSVQLEWMYHDESSSSHWGYACAVDNVYLIRKYSLTNTAGTITGTPVSFDALNNAYARSTWGDVIWNKSQPSDSISIQVEYQNGGVWSLIPDSDLPGNSNEFFTSTASGTLSINTLNTSIYDTLRVLAHLYRKPTRASSDPSLISWEVGNLSRYLSISLSTFEAISGKGFVKVYWRTESESNNAYWIIERAENTGNEWKKITMLPGQGSKPTPTDYSYIDRNIGNDGRYLYRLISIDGNGEQKTYGPVSVIVTGNVPHRFALHKLSPNPFSNKLFIRFDIPKYSNVNLRVYNSTGQVVKTLINGKIEPGYHTVLWNGKGKEGVFVANGIYFLRMDAGKYNKTQKVMYVR